MPQNLICVGEVVRQILGAVIHPQGQPPRRTGGGRGIQPRKPHGDRLKGGEAVASLAHMPADALGVPMLDGGEYPAPAVVHREHPNAVRAPHEVGGMGDDLTDMGISATAAAAMGRASRLFSRITRSTRLRETRMPRQTRSRAQTLRCPSPSQGDASRSASMATSRASSEIEGFGPRRFAGGRSRGGLLPGFHGVERGTGKTPGRTDPLEAVGQTRAGRGGGTQSPRPPPPQRAGRLRLGLQQFRPA